MKKITFILLALISGTAFGQQPVTATADLVSPIIFSVDSGLNFGKISNSTAGSVIIDAISGLDPSSLSQVGNTVPAAAVLRVNAALNYGYDVTYNTTFTITNGTDNITIKDINDNSDYLGDGAEETFNLGGTMVIDGTESTGNYTGDLSVTVTYQ